MQLLQLNRGQLTRCGRTILVEAGTSVVTKTLFNGKMEFCALGVNAEFNVRLSPLVKNDRCWPRRQSHKGLQQMCFLSGARKKKVFPMILALD